MLSILGKKTTGFCDGVSRRGFLKLGAMTIGGFTLADLIKAEASAGTGSSHKAVINIHLTGGPSHQDMFDLKPNAPVEFRGEFNPVATNVPGMQICEHFPMLAQMADKFAVVRSLIGSAGQHSNFQTHSGYDSRDLASVGGHPSLGSVVSRMQGSHHGAPPFISYNGGEPGFLGPIHKPYKPSGGDLSMNRSLTESRLGDRTNLLTSLDRIRRDADASGQMSALDAHTRQAVELIVSGRVGDALDLNKEDAKLVERYGKDGKNFLTARRLIEAGVRVVSLNWGSWDSHQGNFTRLKTQLPKLDVAMSALIQDLHDRGMDQDVTVVMWGEFGRTPRINKTAGRDHWRKVMMAFLAGGGMQTGQMIGTTSDDAGEAKDRPIHVHEVFSTIYRNLGIDTASTTLADTNGRPQYLTDIRQPISELV
ncbi:DUF1501 domain-containing protein [Lignipirellula cremea]|uniref:DUF1501 domain-containing protein n=1 Tax=Lignipirellula cremea TaxID=2528010 RepID=A0A518DWZ7_9BACT|nr:DUF1501 domain-containing protein [Lignipirellula cremea]QDU96359.1 hypothetical protein Pla8534_41790 [Lignipirellula cremea]